jgi:hypothetical protein
MENTTKTSTAHTRDSDCTLDEYDECTVCHVYHGDPCPSCGQRGYHADECDRPAVTDVQHGWSMVGHHYVSFVARGTKTTYVECGSKRQAEVIAEALKSATMRGQV